MQRMTGSPLNLEGITPVDDSRCDAEESDTRDEVVPGITYGCSSAPKGDDASAGLIISRSSGPGALLHLRRTRSSCTSLERTCSRHLSSNSPMPDSQLSDKTSADFRVVQGNNFSLLSQIDADIEEAECEFTEAAVKERYLKHVRPQLMSRGLVLPENLRHRSTSFVHFRTKEITGHKPKYMSILDVMGHEKRMKEDEWQYLLKDMIKTRIYVVENWGSSLCHVVSLMYDHGIISPDDGTNVEFYKAECDASYCGKKQQAELSFLIFKGRKIMHCQVHHEVPCRSSVVAECYAASACLMKAKELGIKNLVICMDSKDSHGVLSGERNIKPGDEHLGVFMMLRKHQNALERVVPVWKERELNQLADDLVTLDKRTTLDPMFPRRAMERWQHLLEGYPVFRFKQKNEVESLTKGFVDNQSYGTASNTVRLEVEEVGKFNCLTGLLDGFEPDDLYVSVYEFAKKPQDLRLKFEELFDGPGREVVRGITVFHKYKDKENLKNKDERTELSVCFDAKLWEASFHYCLTVVLFAPGEAETLGRQHNLRKLSALDYVRFKKAK